MKVLHSGYQVPFHMEVEWFAGLLAFLVEEPLWQTHTVEPTGAAPCEKVSLGAEVAVA